MYYANINSICIAPYKLALNGVRIITRIAPGYLGCHTNVDFQHTNYLLNVTMCEKLRCAHLKIQTIWDAFRNIAKAKHFAQVRVFGLNGGLSWLKGPSSAPARPASRRPWWHGASRAGPADRPAATTGADHGLARMGKRAGVVTCHSYSQ